MSKRIFTLYGQVVRAETRRGIAQTRVELIGNDRATLDKVFRASTTDAAGNFRVPFTELDVRNYFNMRTGETDSPPFFFKVYQDGSLIHTTQGVLTWHPFTDRSTSSNPVVIHVERDDQIFRVFGRVLLPNSRPPDRVFTVEALHSDVATETQLGSTSTSEGDGSYEITYPRSKLPAGEVRANLVVRVLLERTLVTSSPLILGAEDEEEINLLIEGEAFKGQAEYDRLAEQLMPEISPDSLERLSDRSAILLARKTGIPQFLVAYFLQAQILAEPRRLEPPALYALFRQGASTDLAALLAEGEHVHRAYLEAAIAQNIIDASFGQRIEQILVALKEITVEETLAERLAPDGITTLRDVLSTTKLREEQKSLFLRAYLDNQDDLPTFWNRLKEQSDMGREAVEDLQLTLQLATVSLNHLPLLKQLKGRSNLRDARNLAGLTAEEWRELVADIEPPEEIEGDTVDKKRQRYAESIQEVVAEAYPTAILLHRWNRDPDLRSDDFETFQADNPTFEMRETSLRVYLKQHPDALENIHQPERFVSEMEGMQRLFSLMPEPDKFPRLKPLWQAGLRSAHAITRLGEGNFVNRFSGSLGDAQAQVIFANARKKTALSLATLVKYAPLFHASNPAIMPDIRFRDQPDESELPPTWENLFGSLDFCECEHCRSVLSPANYLVDLLQFVDMGNRGEQNALDALLRQRPDLAHIQLNCANTNTVLPYIDLVNELLENAVVHTPFNLSVSNAPQTTWTAAELRAQPEHVRPEAYARLAGHNLRPGQTLPWSLPFNLWHEERNIYLSKLGIRVHELMDTFHREGEDPTPIDQAAALLGMTQTERHIVIGQQGQHGLGTTDKVLEMMERSQTDFETLQTLLTSRYINPAEKAIAFNDESCDLNEATLNLTSTERSRMYRFRKLQLISGFTVEALDHLLETLPFDDINEAFLTQFAQVKRLQDRFALSIPEVLSWWGGLSTRHYAQGNSFYQQLFLNKTVNNPLADAFHLPGDHTELAEELEFFDEEGNLDETVTAIVLGAINITEAELRLLIETTLPAPKVNFAHLSHLYRIASFSRALKMTVSQYLMLSRLFGQDGLTSFNLQDGTLQPATPSDTWAFIEQFNTVAASDFQFEELAYLLMHHQEVGFTPPLDDPTIVILLDYLRSELRKLRLPLHAPELTETSQIERLEQYLVEKLPTVTTQPDAVLAIIRGESQLPEADQIILLNNVGRKAAATQETEPGEIILEVTKLVGDAALTGLLPRLTYAYQRLSVFLTRNVVIQQLASDLDVDVQVMEQLLRVHLPHPQAEHVPAVEFFVDDAFIFATGGPEDQQNHAAAALLHIVAKLALVIQRLGIRAEEVPFVMERGPELGWYNLRTLPVALVTEQVNLEGWLRLVQAYTLNRESFFHDASVVRLLDQVHAENPDREQVLTLLSEQTGWEFASLDYLTGPAGYDFNFPNEYRDERWLVRLSDAFRLIRRAGVSAAHIWKWNQPEASEALARSIKNAAKARYTNQQWLESAPELTEQLRARRRNALVDFLVANFEPIRDADSLYEHLLIDPQVEPCFMTSRIKQAISSVQLFVQRILTGLEEQLRFAPEEAAQWQWRKNYRVWEAARKVFLFPENFAEPEFYDNKSPFFRELEDSLLQEDVTAASVERAYLRYLRQLDEIARLEMNGLYNDEAADVLHIFARTRGVPHTYYYRRWIDQRVFTPWEKVDVNIEGEHLLPVVYNRRLWLLWPSFQEKADEPKNLKSSEGTKPTKYWEIHLNWSEYQEGRWSSPKTSQRFISTKTSPDKEFMHGELGRFYFWAEVLPGQLNVYPYYHHFEKVGSKFVENAHEVGPGGYIDILDLSTEQPNQHFRFTGCSEEPLLLKDTSSGKEGWHFRRDIPYRTNTSTFDDFQKFGRGGASDKTISMFSKISVYSATGQLQEAHTRIERILHLPDKQPQQMRILPPHQYKHFYSQAPFFFEDAQRTFFVVPEAIYEKDGDGSPSIGMLNLDPNQMKLGLADLVREARLPQPAGRRNITQLRTTRAAASAGVVYRPQDAHLVIDRPGNGAGGDAVRPVILETALISQPSAMPAIGPSVGMDISSNETVRRVYHFHIFYHPYTCLFIEQVNRFGIDGLLDPTPKGKGLELHRQLTPNSPFKFSPTYGPAEAFRFGHLKEDIDFRPIGPYSDYNWELFFHIPLMIANRLSQNQRFAEAQQWYHYIFDPTAPEEDLSKDEQFRRFWKIKPFYKFSGETAIEEILRLLNQGDADYEAQVEAWEDDPFNPHLLARLRTVAYMKLVVMKYLDNLIAWADHLFRRDTIESINEATQLYVLAARILGRKPVQVPVRQPTSRTYSQLRENLGLFANVLDELETELQVKAVINKFRALNLGRHPGFKSGRLSLAAKPVDAKASMLFSGDFVWRSPDPDPDTPNPLRLYFCVPHNDRLLGYWDIVADRLFKIRHCQNIEGITRSLALFEPPINPALLVKAAAAGIDLNSALNDLFAPLPHYRFHYMLQKALELCNDVKALGGALLAALEKKDAEALALLRAAQEVTVQKSISFIKEKAIDEAKETRASLEQAQLQAQRRLEEYSARQYMNNREREYIDKFKEARMLQEVAETYNMIASFSFLIPTFQIGIQGVGSSPVSTIEFGGPFFGNYYRALSGVASFFAGRRSYEANLASIMGGYDRRLEDWQLQANLAQIETEQLGHQITAAAVRVQIAEQDLKTHKTQVEHAQEAQAFLQEKYTNQQLYSWMIGQLATLYFQSYQMAYDVAKRAEQCFRHEVGLRETNFIQFGYWDSLKKGLLSGERLYKDLRRMEIAYLEQNRREYELSQHFSLLMLNPRALIDLRETGRCEFSIPEMAFDLAYPGQYMRRIKSVSLTIPCVTGPYVNVSARLALLSNRVRMSSTYEETDDYAYQGINDPNFRHDLIGIQSIATSSAQNDSGLFEFNFRDERYLPFEGAGAISTWSLQLPDHFRQFDYDTISDVILTLNYTAREGGDGLRNTVNGHISTTINNWLDEVAVAGEGFLRWFSLKRDFPTALHQLQHPPQDATEIKLEQRHFPYFLREREITLVQADVILKPKEGEEINVDELVLRLNDLPVNDNANGEEKQNWIAFPDEDSKLRKTSFNIEDEESLEPEGNRWVIMINQDELPAVEDVWLLVRYTVKVEGS